MKKTAYILVFLVTILLVFACGKADDTSTGKQIEGQMTNDTKDSATETTSHIITEEEMREARFCEAVELLEPENGIIMAGTFKVQIAEDIEDKILYTSNDTSMDLYFKDDIKYFYDYNKDCTVYDMAKLCSISADTSVYRLISGPVNAWILGDEEEFQEINVHVQSVLAQVCILKGSQNTCPKELIVGENGMVYGSMMTDYYEVYEDMLEIEKRVYYLLEIPKDEQLNNDDNKTEYINIKSSLIKNSKIVE